MNNTLTSQSQPSEINFKSQSNKNNSETEGKTFRRENRGEGPQGSLSGRTSPSPLPSIIKRKKKAIQHISSINSDPIKEPRPHPIMQDPDFQERYRKFLLKNGLEYGTSDPRKSALWLHFWDVEMKKWYERGDEK